MKKPIDKVKQAFILNQYRSGIESYVAFTREVGLWDSEKYVFGKYLRKRDKILDLGCGTGRTTFPLFQAGYTHITGIDLTPEMIERANELNEYFNTEIDFRTGDATQLVLDEAAFDVVIFSFNGLMSIPGQENRDAALKEIKRVLREQGRFIFTTHDGSPEVMKVVEPEL